MSEPKPDPILFELHITVEKLAKENEAIFTAFCASLDAKPLLIELAQGDFISQPMISKVITGNSLDEALKAASSYGQMLTEAGFPVKRVKIEVPATDSVYFENFTNAFQKYFEWHAKVNYERHENLLCLCERHRAHLSLNALKNSGETRFITVREFGSKDVFERRVHALKNELESENWQVGKEQFEYCIYDNNSFLDNGWLPQ